MAPTERALALAGPLRAALLALEQGLEPPAAFDPARAERNFTIATNAVITSNSAVWSKTSAIKTRRVISA